MIREHLMTSIYLLVASMRSWAAGRHRPPLSPEMTFTLAAHPEAQRRVRQEILDVVGSDRFPRFSDRRSMPITEATLAECTRLRPAAALPPAPHRIT